MLTPIIAQGDYFPADGVSGAFPESSFAAGKIAGVLVQHDGEKRLAHHVADGLIGKSTAEILGESRSSVFKLRVLPLQNGIAGKHSRHQER